MGKLHSDQWATLQGHYRKKGKQMEEINGNIFEVLKGCIDEFCKECCAGPMIYDDDLKGLQRWCDEKCPFLRQFQMIKGEETDDSNIHGRNGKEIKTR